MVRARAYLSRRGGKSLPAWLWGIWVADPWRASCHTLALVTTIPCDAIPLWKVKTRGVGVNVPGVHVHGVGVAIQGGKCQVHVSHHSLLGSWVSGRHLGVLPALGLHHTAVARIDDGSGLPDFRGRGGFSREPVRRWRTVLPY